MKYERICIVGAGAMGGLLGARLALDGRLEREGVELTLVERPGRVALLQTRGLALRSPDGAVRTTRGFRAVVDPAEAGPQDLVVLAVKAYDLPALAPRLPTLFGPETVVVTLQNGIPWWYFQRHGGPLDGRRLESLDPDGTLERHVAPERIIGCIPYPAAEVLEDGSVRHVEGEKLPVGELDGAQTPRLRALAALLESAGFRARRLEDLRSETWLKAWGNLSFNPISALTGATLAGICRFPPTRRLARRMMEEAQEIAHALGARFRVGIDRRIEGAEAVGEHRTSMLQDLEAGRRLESEALVGAVVELGRLTERPAPTIEAIYAALRLLQRTPRAVHGGGESPEVEPLDGRPLDGRPVAEPVGSGAGRPVARGEA